MGSRKSKKDKQLARNKPSLARPKPPQRPNRYQVFLRRLAAGGRSNMYGAVPYLMRAFGVDREQAFRIVCEWMDQQQAALSSAADEKPTKRAS